jgi:hypothetical protein
VVFGGAARNQQIVEINEDTWQVEGAGMSFRLSASRMASW